MSDPQRSSRSHEVPEAGPSPTPSNQGFQAESAQENDGDEGIDGAQNTPPAPPRENVQWHCGVCYDEHDFPDEYYDTNIPHNGIGPYGFRPDEDLPEYLERSCRNCLQEFFNGVIQNPGNYPSFVGKGEVGPRYEGIGF